MTSATADRTRLRRLDDLLWYLAEGVPSFEQSITGPMLEQIEGRAWLTECQTCLGRGGFDSDWLDHKVASWDARHPDDLMTPKRRRYSDWAKKVGKRCPKCRGTGHKPTLLGMIAEPALLDVQPRVGFEGASGVDARETVPEATIMRYAQVSRILGQIPPTIRDALCAAYMAESSRGEMSEAQAVADRVWAVAPLTVAGRELLGRLRTEAEGVVQDECRDRIRSLWPTPVKDQAEVLAAWAELSAEDFQLPAGVEPPNALPQVGDWSWREIRKQWERHDLEWVEWVVKAVESALAEAKGMLAAAEDRWTELVGKRTARGRVRPPLVGSVGHLAAWIRTQAPAKKWDRRTVTDALAACDLTVPGGFDVRQFAKVMPVLADAYFAEFRYWQAPGAKPGNSRKA